MFYADSLADFRRISPRTSQFRETIPVTITAIPSNMNTAVLDLCSYCGNLFSRRATPGSCRQTPFDVVLSLLSNREPQGKRLENTTLVSDIIKFNPIVARSTGVHCADSRSVVVDEIDATGFTCFPVADKRACDRATRNPPVSDHHQLAWFEFSLPSGPRLFTVVFR